MQTIPSGRQHHHAALLACSLLLLFACDASEQPAPSDGGDEAHDGGDAGLDASGTVIGATGGTVLGPNGSKVEIPPGALDSDTTIRIEQTSRGAPELPAGVIAFGPMFAATPHGTRFAVPVTLTLPFDQEGLPEGAIPELYKTNDRDLWDPVAGATFSAERVTAEISAFSSLQVVIPALVSADPVREWTFGEFRGDALEPFELNSGEQVEGTLEEIHELGPAFFDAPYTRNDGVELEPDDIAVAHVFSSETGLTYSVFTEAPLGDADDAEAAIGSISRLRQGQSFKKLSAEASLKFTLTKAALEVYDGNGVLGRRCPAKRAGGQQCDLIHAEVFFDVHATNFHRPIGTTFFHTAGGATLIGFAESWDSQAITYATAGTPLWTIEDFDFAIEDFNGPEGHVVMLLRRPRTFTLDLSGIEIGDGFVLWVDTFALAYNRIAGPPSEFETAAKAFLRDPLSIEGTTVEIVDLEPIATPAFVTRPDNALVPPLPCGSGQAPNAATGELQLSSPSYATAESSITPTVTVTRSGGSSGAVTASFATSDGSAVAGVDYTSVSTTVFFGDGDAEPRVVPIPIIQDLNSDEPDVTVLLTLSEPGGCAALGALTSSVLTIRDDDVPPLPPSFTVGGTVSGLLGSGLVLHEVITGESISPANGPFAFSQRSSSGGSYEVEVRMQPSDPMQVCSVSQGSGTLQDENVTDVAVQCTTVTLENGLDPSFGGTGKVSTAFGGTNMAMALQADGKVVAVGGSSNGFVLARYDVDGSLDNSFGSEGLITTDLPDSTGEEAHAVALQADGKIVVAGFTVIGRTPNNRANFDFALARYESDGELDLSFGTGGSVTTDFSGFGDQAFAVAVQADGAIVVAGSAGFGTASGLDVGSDYGLARYGTDGVLDPSFGSAGLVTTDLIGGTDIVQSIVVQPADGAIVVSGHMTSANDSGLDHTGIVRYTASGGLDGSFGSAGKVTFMDSRVDEGLTLQADGKILLVGSADAGVAPDFITQLAVVRLAADGSNDDSFGVQGQATAELPGFNVSGRAVAVDEAGRIVAVGRASQDTPSQSDFAVARYQASGSLDPSFGSNGTLTIDFFGDSDGAERVAVQPDGAIVVAGAAKNGVRTGYGLARILP